MSDPIISQQNINALYRYQQTLITLPQEAQRIKQQLDIGADPHFLRIYQPALEATLQLADSRLKYWAPLQTFYPRIFHDQQRLNADIRCFHEQFEAIANAMPQTERKNFLDRLDFQHSPFTLESRLLVLTVGPGFKFAQQMKSMVTQTWTAFNSAKDVIDSLHRYHSEIVPRYIDFLKGAVDSYILKNKLDPIKGDARTASVSEVITSMEKQQHTLVFATQDLSEGFSRLVSMQGIAVSEFATLFGNISVENFQLMVELAVPALDEAEEMANFHPNT